MLSWQLPRGISSRGDANGLKQYPNCLQLQFADCGLSSMSSKSLDYAGTICGDCEVRNTRENGPPSVNIPGHPSFCGEASLNSKYTTICLTMRAWTLGDQLLYEEITVFVMEYMSLEIRLIYWVGFIVPSAWYLPYNTPI